MSWPAVLLVAVMAPPLAYPAFPADTDFTTVSRWAARQTDIPEGDLLDVRRGLAFAVLPAAAGQGVRKVRVEAVEARAWKALGGRSAELTIDLGCGPNRITAQGLDVYAASNRQGEVRRGVPPALLRLSQTDLATLASALCSPPLQARPLVEAEIEPSRSPPEPTEAAAAAEAVEPRTPAKDPRARGRLAAVQVGAFASREVAEKALQGLNASRPDLQPRIEVIGPGAALVYRALLTGFPTPWEAADFCRDLAKLGRPCLVRGLR